MKKLLLFSVVIIAAISFIIKLGSLQISGSNPEAFKTDPAISAQTIYHLKRVVSTLSGTPKMGYCLSMSFIILKTLILFFMKDKN